MQSVPDASVAVRRNSWSVGMLNLEIIAAGSVALAVKIPFDNAWLLTVTWAEVKADAIHSGVVDEIGVSGAAELGTLEVDGVEVGALEAGTLEVVEVEALDAGTLEVVVVEALDAGTLEVDDVVVVELVVVVVVEELDVGTVVDVVSGDEVSASGAPSLVGNAFTFTV